MIQLITEVMVVARRSIADQFTQDLTKPVSGRERYASPEGFGIKQVFGIIN